MVQMHPSSASERAQWVSQLIVGSGVYGTVSGLSRSIGVSRQTLYTWKASGREALEQVFTPIVASPRTTADRDRSILTLLVDGHASERDIQDCLVGLGLGSVSLGTISAVIGDAQRRALRWFASYQAPAMARIIALDEMYGNDRHGAYLSIVDAVSAVVWATAGPVAVDGDSWTLLLWDAQERGITWTQTISDGGTAIAESCARVDPKGQHSRDVWHVLHQWSQVQGRLDRLVAQLQAQTATVARQATRVAAGERPRGRTPHSDVAAHAAHVATATRAAAGLRYLGQEFHHLLGVVVLAPRAGILGSCARQSEAETVLDLLGELTDAAPPTLQSDLRRLHTGLRHALPALLVFANRLDPPQETAEVALGTEGLALLAWAWQRRAILGPTRADLLALLPASWRAAATALVTAWEGAVRASSAVENWHSVLRPHLAIHRTLSPGLLALLAVWHNHRRFARGVHAGHSPLGLSGLTALPTDWLDALGYPPVPSPQPALSSPHLITEKCLVA